jgi:hypothetical protein
MNDDGDSLSRVVCSMLLTMLRNLENHPQSSKVHKVASTYVGTSMLKNLNSARTNRKDFESVVVEECVGGGLRPPPLLHDGESSKVIKNVKERFSSWIPLHTF